MALPHTVRVKLSSEAAEAISITQVVVQDIALRELVEHMLGVAGKDLPRIRDLLLRGAMVSGASRFRWAGWEADADELLELLATFPDPDPSLPFAGARCAKAVLRGGRRPIEIAREAVSRGGLLRRTTFWDALMREVGGGAAYAGYSYRERADKYERIFHIDEIERLIAASDAIPYSTLREAIRMASFTAVELYATRA